MKKYLVFIMLCACAINVQAKSDLQLTSGSLSELKGSKAKVCATWDYSKSTIENQEIKAFLKEKGPEWERDYDAEIQRAEANFISRINDKTKDIQAITDKKQADYEIVVKVRNFDYGRTALAVVVGFGSGDARIYGTMEIYKKGVKQPIAVLDMDGVSGDGFGNEKRRVEAYRELAELLAKLIKKAK